MVSKPPPPIRRKIRRLPLGDLSPANPPPHKAYRLPPDLFWPTLAPQKGYRQPPDLFGKAARVCRLLKVLWFVVILMFKLSLWKLSLSKLFVRKLESVKLLGLFGLLLGFHLGLHLGLLVLLLKLDLSPWGWRAENAIKAVLERNWDAAISYLIAKKKKNYPFVFAGDGVPVMAGTNRMFTAGSAGYHIRGLYSASINDSGICVHMVDYAQGMVANQAMVDIAILDTGSPVHCTGDISLFSDYHEAEMVDYVVGVGGGKIGIYGTGTISDRRFQMKDVLYIPGLNQGNLKKTIFSVGKLCEDGYRVNFDAAGGCTVIDMRSRVWSWARLTWIHEIVGKGRIVYGQCHMDYLRMRAPVSSLEGIGVVKLLCKAASLVWSTITRCLHFQGHTAQRIPV